MDFLDILKAAGLLIAALSILVTWHELGHFIPAKLFGMRVDKFFLFMDWPYKIWSFKRGETEYGIGTVPIGGYVKIYGMVDESMDTENLNKAPEPYEFRAKPIWQRLIVMVGGVTMNVILAIIIYSVLAFVRGETKTPVATLPNGIEVLSGSLADTLGFQTGDRPVAVNGIPLTYLEDAGRAENIMADSGYFEVDRGGQRIRIEIPREVLNMMAEINERRGMQPLFMPNYSNQIMAPGPDTLDGETTPGYAAGLRTGDRIVAIDSTSTLTFAELRTYVKSHANQQVAITALRGADTLLLTATIDSLGRLGIAFLFNSVPLDTIEYGFFGSIAKGWENSWGTLWGNIIGLGKVFSGDVDASKSVSGPIGIAKLYAKMDFWSLTAMLSMVLAFMNILPIPALDGGHVIILLIEGAIRRELPLKTKMMIQQIGFFLMIGLMILIFFNDIVKLFD